MTKHINRLPPSDAFEQKKGFLFIKVVSTTINRRQRMGTDLTMTWDNIHPTQERKRDRYHPLKSGKHGYIRAGMTLQLEQDLILEMFPDHKFYNQYAPGTDQPIYHSYDFIKNRQKHIELLVKYSYKAMPRQFSDAIEFLNSMHDFLELGRRKQRNGLNPKIHISR